MLLCCVQSLKGVDRQLEDAPCDFLSPLCSQPTRVIEGAPSIKQYKVLNDKRHVLTRDSDGHVALYDVLYVSQHTSCLPAVTE